MNDKLLHVFDKVLAAFFVVVLLLTASAMLVFTVIGWSTVLYVPYVTPFEVAFACVSTVCTVISICSLTLMLKP